MSPVRFVAGTSPGVNVRGRRGRVYERHYGAEEYIALAEDLKKVPANMRRNLGNRLRQVGGYTVARIQFHARWSSRIPGAVRLRVQFAGKAPGLVVSVDHNAAPHARPFEGLLSRGGVFRHPVFGDRDNWVAQDARPFLWPGVVESQQEVAEAVEEAISETFTEAGFR